MEGRNFGKFLRLFVLLALTAALVFAIGTAAFSQGTPPEEEKECYIVGDMNTDGVVTSADAIYLLYHYTLGDEQYPVNQEADVNGDDVVEAKDAIDLLYAFYGWGDESTAHVGTEVHDYYDPAWNWTEDGDAVTAQVTLKCACGEPEIKDVAVNLVANNEASCAAPGAKVYEAEIVFNGQTWQGSYTQVLPALAHQPGAMVTTDAAQHYQLCTVCETKLNAENHTWKQDGDKRTGDCKTQSTQHYVCDCGAEKTEQLGLEEHAYVYVGDVLENATNCTYAKQYQCSVCGDTYKDDLYTNHNYIKVVTVPATCQQPGEMASKCAACGDVRSTEEIAANNHDWYEGEVIGGIRTDTCKACPATKTTAVAANGGISQDVLQNSSEVAVGDATMSMDDAVKENLNAAGQIEITVDKIHKDEVEINGELTEDQLEQIGENQVYDFNMTIDGSPVSEFAGKITISLPYELGKDEDIDSIDVWYIADDGTLVQQEATYSNGYITFEVTHFSYYTVTRLTAAERCARYGHIWTDSSKTVTCTTDGYTSQVCQRCNETKDLVEIHATGHKYQVTEKAATCTEFGYKDYKCEICSHVYSEITGTALGHDMQSATTEATCDAAGKISYYCTRCDLTHEEVLPQLTHDYQHDAQQDVVPSCTLGGWEVHVCQHCGDTVKKNEKAALGHNHPVENATWVWENAEDEAVVTVSCSHEGCSAKKELKPNVVVTEASCETEGTITATVYYNGTKFEKSHSNGDAKGHEIGDKWHANQTHHYHRCDRCGAQEDAAEHVFDDGVVTVEPNCVEVGLKVYTCQCGYTYEEVLAATGVHSLNAGVVTKQPTCTADGVKTYSCEQCKYTERETLPATGHTEQIVPAVEATCTKTGLTEGKYCATCNKVLVAQKTVATVSHNFVGDVCTECGKIGSCDHTEFTVTEIELPKGACNPGKVYKVSCQCGDRQSVMMSMLDCALDYEGDEATEDGRWCETYGCRWCDLELKIYWASEWFETGCGVVNTREFQFVFQGAVICTYTETERVEHPVGFYGDEGQHLTDLGMCPLFVVPGRCNCGERTEADVEESCEFTYMGDGSWKCTECGVTKTYTCETISKEGCYAYDEYTFVYVDANGKELYRYSHVERYSNHAESGSAILLGDSCEDGWVYIADCENCDYFYMRYGRGHDAQLVERYDLSDYGMCGGNVDVYACPCGQESWTGGRVDCNFVRNRDYMGEGECFVCTECGGMYVNVHEEYWENACVVRLQNTTTYWDPAGNEIASFVESWTNEHHQYILQDYVMLGNSCEDGVEATYSCINCGDHFTETYYGHQTQIQETYFGEEFGICGLTIRVEGCLCGEVYCDTWAMSACPYVLDETYEDGMRYYCEVCGMEEIRRFSTVEESDCVYWEARDYYYFNAEGEKIYHFTSAGKIENHDYQCETHLLGDSCEDGVEATYTCTKCGESYTETYYWHRNESYYYGDLSQYGLCGGWMEGSSCACGENQWSNYDFHCNFQHVDTIDGIMVYFCEDCGTYIHVDYYQEVVSDCLTDFRYRAVISNKFLGDKTITFGVRGRQHNHLWRFDIQLMEGATSCEEGVIVREYCQRCDWENEWTIYEHNTYALDREVLSDGQFCGTVERVHYGCACGEYTHTNIENNGCNYYYNGYDENLDREIWVCDGCGTIRYNEQSSAPVEGMPCQVRVTNTYYYMQNGEVVFSYEGDSWIRENHTMLAQFTLLGKTCDDGFNVYMQCKYCDYGYDDGMTYYGCGGWRVDYVQGVGAAEGFCGTAALNVYRCACGRSQHIDFFSNCNFEYWGSDAENNADVFKCTNCGLMYSDRSTYETVKEECVSKDTREIVFMVQDGDAVQVIKTISYTIARDAHTYLATFEKLGDTCEDGYRVYNQCKYCDYGYALDDIRYGCSSWLVDMRTVVSEDIYCAEVYEYTYNCACGACYQHDIIYNDGNCSFEGKYNEALNRTEYICATCGLMYTEEWLSDQVVDPEKPCYCLNGWRYTYYNADGVVIGEAQNDWRTESHNYLNSFRLLGDTCEDGYYLTRTCQICGHSYEEAMVYYGCDNWLVKTEIVLDGEEHGFCGSVSLNYHRCACGKNAYVSVWRDMGCNFEWVYEESLQRHVYRCNTCGLYYTEQSYSKHMEGELPCVWQTGWRYTYYHDGQVVCQAESVEREYRHEYTYSFNMQGDTCEDGYTVLCTCVHCGDSSGDGMVYNSCDTLWQVGRETVLSDDAYCCEIYQIYDSCACGKNTRVYVEKGTGCNTQWTYVEHLGGWTDVCTVCGLYSIATEYKEQITGEELCHYWYGWDYTYYCNGQVVCQAERRERTTYHAEINSFKMLGTTCEDGYEVIKSCLYCDDYTHSYGVYYGCMEWVTAREAVLDDPAYCEKVTLLRHSCPCGAMSHEVVERAWNCKTEWTYVEHLGGWANVCTECGLYYTGETYNEPVDPANPCLRDAGEVFTYYCNGEKLFSVASRERRYEHTSIYSFKMNGTTCDEGYDYWMTCVHCQTVVSQGTSSGCMTYPVAYYSLKDYGMCGGYLRKYSCACGNVSTMDWNIECSYTWLDELEKGNQYRYCADCDTKFCFGNWAETKYEECALVTTYFLKAYRNDVQIVDQQWQTRRPEHKYLAVGFNGTCGDMQVVATMECKYCKKQETGYSMGEHPSFLTGFIDLEGMGACGGYIEMYQCPCGEYTNYSKWHYTCKFEGDYEEEIMVDGNTLCKSTLTCPDCGLELYEEWFTARNSETCQTITTRSIWVRMNGVEHEEVFTEREIQVSHRYGKEVYTLNPGSTTCEDGVTGSRTCLDCGYSETWGVDCHSAYYHSGIDLKQYGSVCGCELEYYACACGQYQYYRLSDEACDLDQNWTNLWIDNAIPNGSSQPTTMGWNWFYSDAYVYTCAVTDPQCGLKVRMAEYWVQEGCEAVRYKTWQLGYTETYNETTGTWEYNWDREITLATGERRTYHAYENTSTNETLSDGTDVYTNSYVCKNCGSSHVETTKNMDGWLVYSETTTINLLNNGENQRSSQIRKYDFELKGSRYQTYEKEWQVYADGTEYWYENTYEYVTGTECKRITTHRTSSGSMDGVWEDMHPMGYTSWEWVEYPTCSQTGLEKETHRCLLCETVTYEYVYEREPYGHAWYMDPNTGVYECSRCGLENSNGADGTIIMEDLTAQYGKGVDYVVGYYNRGMNTFTAFASVVLLDANGEEIVLQGIEFTYLSKKVDGIQAITANQAAIQQAAAAALQEAGYTGNYAIRIAFVPDTGDSDLDYAITFDSQTT